MIKIVDQTTDTNVIPVLHHATLNSTCIVILNLTKVKLLKHAINRVH